MQFESFSQFINMGGHALYVWLSYGLAMVILVFNFIVPLFQQKSILISLRKRIARESTKK